MVVFGKHGLPAQAEIDHQPLGHMKRILRIQAEHVLAKVVQLRAALAEGIHLAREKIEQRVVLYWPEKLNTPSS